VGTLNNSVVSGNTAGGAFNDLYAYSNDGAVPIGGNNLIGVSNDPINGVDGNIVGVDNPQLLPLGNYGGPTQTMPPRVGSLAINGGSNSSIPNGITIDQRGEPRVEAGVVDIGAVELASGSISGSIYNDLNGDGRRGSTDPALSGWECFIDTNHNGVYDTGEPHAVSDSTGQFTFGDLAPGIYAVTQLPPAGWHRTGSRKFFDTVTLQSGQNITTVQFANRDVGTGSATGYVFNDTNADGSFDEGDQDTNVTGRTVYADLYDIGQLVPGDPTTTTDYFGNFTLTGITAGEEIIRQVQPTGWLQTAPAKLEGAKIRIPAGGTVTKLIFGTTQAASIAGTVFNDANGNAKRDNGEPGLGGWTVDALLNNAVVEQTTTDATGAFGFQDLKAGTYIIRIAVKPGYKQTVPAPNPGETIALPSGGMNLGVTFGEQKIA
jgi:uncharacterized protein (DUF2141 family)